MIILLLQVFIFIHFTRQIPLRAQTNMHVFEPSEETTPGENPVLFLYNSSKIEFKHRFIVIKL